MNIFYVDSDPVIAAQSLVDRHVVKMVLETAQLLSTVHRVLDGIPYADTTGKRTMIRFKIDPPRDVLYVASHVKHPCAVWVRDSRENYDWLRRHFMSLLDEYHYRYEKTHKCNFLVPLFFIPPTCISTRPFAEPPQCMPVEYMVRRDTVAAYRNYYNDGKKHLHKYTKRQQPLWLKSGVSE